MIIKQIIPFPDTGGLLPLSPPKRPLRDGPEVIVGLALLEHDDSTSIEYIVMDPGDRCLRITGEYGFRY